MVFAWLVGITGAEARFVEQNGWEAFEALLEERNPDLLDFGRESAV